MIKKIILGLILLLAAGVGVLFALNGSRHYDPSRYHLRLTPTAKPFGVGSTIDVTLPDQFDVPQGLPGDTRKVVFVFTKATGHIFRSWMASHNTRGYLAQRKIVAVADVSGMPAVILNTFAMPDFRKSPYSILLIYDPKMATRLKEGQAVDRVIVMTLANRTVTHIAHADSIQALDRLLR